MAGNKVVSHEHDLGQFLRLFPVPENMAIMREQFRLTRDVARELIPELHSARSVILGRVNQDRCFVFYIEICKSKPYVSGSEVMGLYVFRPYPVCIGTLFGVQTDNRICNHAVLTYKNPVLTVPFVISRYDQPETLGKFIRRRRFEKNLLARELASLIGVTEDTVLNWEKDRTYPSQKKVILLKERLDMDPFELIEFDGAISKRQKSILNLITELGSITRGGCQELLGLRQQYTQNDLFFLYRLGVLGRTLGKRKKATYFLSKSA